MNDPLPNYACLAIPDLDGDSRVALMCAEANTPDAKTAKAVCSTCRYQQSCLAWALRTGQESCTHAGIAFGQRFLNRWRKVRADLDPEVPHRVVLDRPCGWGQPGEVVLVVADIAAALMAAKRAHLLEEALCAT